MSGELSALIREAEAGWEQVEAGKEVDQVGRARLVGRARRTRAMRTGMVAAAAAVLVAAAGGGVVLLTRPEPAPPVDTQTTAPSPSSSASPSPTPAPTPTSAPTPTETAPPNPGFAGTVTVDPHLPSAQAITPEVWAKAGSGWVLASYQESGYDASGSTLVPAGPQMIYLVSPDGLRYQLTEVQGDVTAAVVAWRPGTTTALVHLVQPSGVDGGWARLDLRSGLSMPVEVLAGTSQLGAVLDDGRAAVMYHGSGETYVTGAIDADGVLGPVAPLDSPGALAAARTSYPDHDCTVVGRYDPRTAVVSCVRGRDTVMNGWPTSEPKAEDLDALLVTVGDDGRDTPTTLAHLDGLQTDQARWDAVHVVAGVVVVDGWYGWGPDAGPGRWVHQDGHFTNLPGVAALSAGAQPQFPSVAGWSGTSTYSRVSPGVQESAPTALVRDDLATGRSTVLVPFPASNPDEGPDRLWQSLTGCYVVP